MLRAGSRRAARDKPATLTDELFENVGPFVVERQRLVGAEAANLAPPSAAESPATHRRRRGHRPYRRRGPRSVAFARIAAIAAALATLADRHFVAHVLTSALVAYFGYGSDDCSPLGAHSRLCRRRLRFLCPRPPPSRFRRTASRSAGCRHDGTTFAHPRLRESRVLLLNADVSEHAVGDSQRALHLGDRIALGLILEEKVATVGLLVDRVRELLRPPVMARVDLRRPGCG